MATVPLYRKLLDFWGGKPEPSDKVVYSFVLAQLRLYFEHEVAAIETHYSEAAIQQNGESFKKCMPVLEKWYAAINSGAPLPILDQAGMADIKDGRFDKCSERRYAKSFERLVDCLEIAPDCDFTCLQTSTISDLDSPGHELPLKAIPRLPDPEIEECPDYAYTLISFALYELLLDHPGVEPQPHICEACHQVFLSTKTRDAKYCCKQCREVAKDRKYNIPGVGPTDSKTYRAWRRWFVQSKQYRKRPLTPKDNAGWLTRYNSPD